MNMYEVNKAITDYCTQLNDNLIKKNIAYNNSLHNPISIFQQNNTIEGICCRIDDKLNRIKCAGITGDTEDSIDDLIGYLVHLKISLQNENK